MLKSYKKLVKNKLNMKLKNQCGHLLPSPHPLSGKNNCTYSKKRFVDGINFMIKMIIKFIFPSALRIKILVRFINFDNYNLN